jgi:pyruvate/2-oxoglutarate/acetoin dehydrogenase E1 component
VAEQALHDLDDAWIVATEETPIPYSPALEDAHIPDAEAIAAAVRSRAGVGSGAAMR